MTECFKCHGTVEETFKFCPHCGVDLNSHIRCPKCGYDNEPNSKFCQECGTKISTAAPIGAQPSNRSAVEEMEPPPESGVTVEFPYSSAQSFDFAVASAKTLPNYKVFGEDKKAVYRVTVPAEDVSSLDELIENLKGWRKRTVYVDGTKVQWDSVFSYAWCYNKKKASYKPDLYCFGYENQWEFNIWGCIQAHMSFAEHQEWFTYGQWIDKKGTWQFDKERIRHELEKNLFPFRFCPAMNTSLVEEMVNALPDKVNPLHDKDWQFHENYGSDEGLVVSMKRYGYTDQVSVNGVSPNGKNPIKKIFRQIRTRLPNGIL